MALVLSIDGGGIRGLIPAIVLAEISRRLQLRGIEKPLCELVHLTAGTSTGGIIAAGLTCPHPHDPKRPSMTPAELVSLYEAEGPEIFNAGFFRKLHRGLIDESYSEKPLEMKLAKHLGDARLSEGLGAVMITAYDIGARETMFMKGGRVRGPGAWPKPPADYRFRDAARATSAAPTFFEPAPVTDVTGSKTHVLIDGGVFNNDPAMSAYVEAVKLGHAPDEITVVSLGTGYLTRPFSYNKARNWGALGWIDPREGAPILSIMMHGQAHSTNHHLDRLLNLEDQPKRYHRLDIALTMENGGASDDMDDTTPKNMANLRRTAMTLIERENDTIEEVVSLLAAEGIAAPIPAPAPAPAATVPTI